MSSKVLSSRKNPSVLDCSEPRLSKTRRGGGRTGGLPPGHRFYADAQREVNARSMDWALKKDKGGIFATLTFKSEVSERKANRMVGRWLARASQGLQDKGGGSLKSFCATEWQKRGVIHYHLLLTGHDTGLISRKRLESRWTAIGGGIARCYDATEECAAYLAKYTSKTLGGDLEWNGNWQGYKIPGSLSANVSAHPA